MKFVNFSDENGPLGICYDRNSSAVFGYIV